MEKKLCAGQHRVRPDRGTVGERAVRVRPRDSVRDEGVPALVPPERDRSRLLEAAVHLDRPEPVATKPELEHGDVPPHRAHGEQPLAEQRAPAGAERTACLPVDPPVGPQPVLPLKRRQGRARDRPGDPVDRASVESVGAERDLHRGDARVRTARVVRESAGDDGQRSSCDGETTHGAALRGVRPPSSPV